MVGFSVRAIGVGVSFLWSLKFQLGLSISFLWILEFPLGLIISFLWRLDFPLALWMSLPLVITIELSVVTAISVA